MRLGDKLNSSVTTRPGNRGPRGPELGARQSSGLTKKLSTPEGDSAPVATGAVGGKRRRKLADALGAS